MTLEGFDQWLPNLLSITIQKLLDFTINEKRFVIIKQKVSHSKIKNNFFKILHFLT